MLKALRWYQPEEADAWWEQCSQRLHSDHLTRLYRALHTISRGKLREGFRLREAMMATMSRNRRTTMEPPRDIPEWTRQPLKEKSIAIWSEFGLGDEIFFMRFARIFREESGAARVVLVCHAPLVELYEASGEADQVVDSANAANFSGVDYWVFPHAIPAHLPLDLESLPSTVPYLRTAEHVPSKLPIVEKN